MEGDEPTASGAQGKTIRLILAVKDSKRPVLRPAAQMPVQVASAQVPDAISDVLSSAIDAAVAQANASPTTPVAVVATAPPASTAPTASEDIVLAAADTSARPSLRPTGLVVIGAQPKSDKKAEPQEVVTRVSTSGGRHWGVNVGRFGSRYAAEKVLIKTALAEMSSLDGSLRKVVQKPQGFDANFLGMTRETADLACRRLKARNVSCFMIGPS